MTLLTAALQPQVPLVLMQANPAVDSQLSVKTAAYLHTVGLPISDELGFSFTGQMVLLPSGVVRLIEAPEILFVGTEKAPEGRNVCLDLLQGELIR